MESLKKGINLFDKVIAKLREINYVKLDSVSFLFFGCETLEEMEIVKNHPLTKNVVIVSDKTFKRDNVITMKNETWNENKEVFLNLTKNCVVINGNNELVSEETYSFLKLSHKYYPIVLILSQIKLKKNKIKEVGYHSHTDGFSYCNLNTNMKSFKSFVFEDFNEIEYKIKQIEDLNSLEYLPKKRSPIAFNNKQQREEFSFLSGLKSPVSKNVLDKYNFPISRKWLQEFYEYLKDLLNRFFPEDKKKYIDVILNNETLKKYWIPCFTHKTANPNPGENYDSVETLGDGTIGYCFKFYIKETDPSASDSRISNLNQLYDSKIFQSKVGKKMKLHEWLISCGMNTDRMDINEDLLEALCGTIDIILFEKSGKLGIGISVLYNLVKLIFEDVEFESDAEKNIEPDKTYVRQIFQLSVFKPEVLEHYTDLKKPKEIPQELWKKIVKDINKGLQPYPNIYPVRIKEDSNDHPGLNIVEKKLPSGKISFEIYILKEQVMKLRKYGIRLPPEEIKIGESTKSTRKIAEKEAYTRAKEFLISKGMTREWRNTVKNRSITENWKGMEQVEEKARKKFPGVKNVTVEKVKTSKEKVGNLKKEKTEDVVIYQITGEEKSGKKVVLFTLATQDKNYYQEVIDEYLSKP